MTSGTGDAGLRRAVEAVERGARIILTPKRMVRREGGSASRGSPAVVARGLTRVQYPGEEPRELERFEVEAILATAAEGGVSLLVPFIPGLGHGGRPRWASFRLEDGSVVGPDCAGYPDRAISGA